MDIFEKQQTIDAIKTAVKARWFYVLAVAFQAMIVKLLFPGVPLATSPLISLVVLLVLVSNFGFWVYLRQSPEKIGDLALKTIKGSLVIFDQLAISVVFYFSGTANKMLFILYFVTIMLGSSLYKTKGVIMVTFSAAFLYSGLIFLEYFGLMPPISPEAAINSPGKLFKGELYLVKGQLLGFNLYLLTVAIVAGYLASLFRKREKKLTGQKNELVKKTDILTLQTQELTQAKDQLESALVKSDIARKAATQARDEMEKANLELKKKIDELGKFYKITIGREVRMAELKSEIKELKETIKKLDDELSKK